MNEERTRALLDVLLELSASLCVADVSARLARAPLRLGFAIGVELALDERDGFTGLRVTAGETRLEPALELELRAHGERLGRLRVFARGAPDEASQNALRTLAAHGGLALANARAHEAALIRAERDALTGLANHGHVWEALEREASRAQRYGRALAFVMLDVDRFKAFNDRHGHLAGDAALAQIAALVRERSRASDTAGRYGGDELALVLPETSAEGAIAVAEKIRAAAEALALGAGLGKLTVSAGVACSPTDGKTAADLVRGADARLYRAKAAGGNRVVADR